MSFKFGKVVRTMLLADSAVRAALPGGIHPDEIPATVEDPRDKPAGVYWLVSATPRRSLTRFMGVNDCVLGFRFYGATIDQKQAAISAIASVIHTNRARYSDGTDTICGLSYSDISGGIERVPDDKGKPDHFLDLTITGAVGT